LEVLHHKDAPQTSAHPVEIGTNTFIYKERQDSKLQGKAVKHKFKSGLSSILMSSTAYILPW